MPLVEVQLHIPDALIVGGIPCGPALTPYDHADLTVSEYITDHPTNTNFYRVEGESMMGLGIIEGDVVAIDMKLEPRDEDIVMVAIEGGQYTIKSYEPYATPPGLYGYDVNRQRTHVWFDEATILGVLVSLVRRYRGKYRVVFTHDM